MLENLDKIDWSKLTHAYGPAGDVPGLLRRLASSSAGKREKAIYELYGNIWHQGSVYEASVYAVPFLLELLESPEVAGKDELLVLLAHLAKGHSYHDVHQHLSFMKEKAKGQEWQDNIQKELGWVRDVKQAVKAGENLYLGFLNDTDASLCDRAAYLLASLDRPSVKMAEAVWKRLEKEKDEGVQASLVMAFGILAEHTEANTSSLLAMLFSSSSKSVKLAAAMSLVRLSPSEQSEEAVGILLDAAQSRDNYNALAKSIWAEDDLQYLLLNHLTCLEGNAARAAENALTSALPGRPHPEALCIAEILLTMAFPHSIKRDATFALLNEKQQGIVKLIAESQNVWTEKIGRYESNSVKTAMMLQSCGLPDQRPKLQAFVCGVERVPIVFEPKQKRAGIAGKLKKLFRRWR